jgi:hypothetical protein
MRVEEPRGAIAKGSIDENLSKLHRHVRHRQFRRIGRNSHNILTPGEKQRT